MLYNHGVFGSCSNGADFRNLFPGYLFMAGYCLYCYYVVGPIQRELQLVILVVPMPVIFSFAARRLQTPSLKHGDSLFWVVDMECVIFTVEISVGPC